MAGRAGTTHVWQALGVGVAAAALAHVVVGPRMATWGTTADVAGEPLVGDESVA
jgi:hypothetical protein